MLLEAIDWLAREIIVDKSMERAFRGLERRSPGAGTLATRLYVGATLGRIVGSYAGRQTAANIERGMPSTVALEYTPDIAAYDKSALRSTRII